MTVAKGAMFHGEFSSADASALSEANSRLALYGAAAAAALTLDANDTVEITDLVLSVGAAALAVTVYDGSDATVDAGERIAEAFLPVNGTVVIPLATPHVCQKGSYPKVKTSAAGAVRVQAKGTIYRRGA